MVKYGLNQTWTEEKDVQGSIECTNEVFGNILKGIKKECRCTPPSKLMTLEVSTKSVRFTNYPFNMFHPKMSWQLIDFLGDSPQNWCCSTLNQYPDFIPTQNWGSLVDDYKRRMWNDRNCNKVVGGSSKSDCKGRNLYWLFVKTIMNIKPKTP